MANEVKNVTASKPKIGGAISVAPLNSKLPEDATTALDLAFKSLGYVSEDGLVNENNIDSDSIKAWGGDTVLNISKGRDDIFSLTLLEALNIEVLKEVYGANNVNGTLEAGIKITVNSSDLEEHVLVVELILKGGILKRIVIPDAKVIEISEITYKDDEAVGYGLKIQAFPDAKGNTHYEYIKKGM